MLDDLTKRIESAAVVDLAEEFGARKSGKTLFRGLDDHEAKATDSLEERGPLPNALIRYYISYLWELNHLVNRELAILLEEWNELTG